MLCPNCHSDDVISVQDQLICVNCGRSLTATEAAAQKKKTASTPQVKVIKKQRPGRPRAAKLDTPVTNLSKPVADIKAPQQRARPVAQHTGERASRELTHGSVVGSAFRALRPTWIALALPGAALVVSAITYAVSSYLYTPRPEQGNELVVSLAIFMSGMVALRYIRSAVIFQRAGIHDHRLSSFGAALRTAMARSGQLALLNIRHIAFLLGELALLGLVVWYGGHLTIFPNWLHIAVLFIASFALLYLLAGIWIVHRLIEAGIVVSGLSLTAAQWLGWRLWRKHGELLGVRIIGLLVILLVTGGIAVGLDVILKVQSYIIQVTVAVLLASLSVAVLTVMSGGAAEASYRQLVAMSQPRRSARLLGSRHSIKPSLGSRTVLVGAFVIPLLAAIVVGTVWH